MNAIKKYWADKKAAEAPITTNLRNIGMLRQWLNEDRISDPEKMITNEDIASWLTLH